MRTASYRVLVVDDDPAQADMVIEFLRISGFKDIDLSGYPLFLGEAERSRI